MAGMARSRKSKNGSRTKSLLDYIAYALARVLLIPVRLLPFWLITPAGRIFGLTMFFIVHGKYKKIAYKNMDIVYKGEHSWWQKRRLLARSFKEMGGNIFFLVNIKKSLGHIDALYEVRGFEKVAPYVKEGRGFVGVSLHMGLFMLVCQKLARLGLGTTYLIRAPKNERMAVFMFDFMAPYGISYVLDKPKRACVAGVLRALREGRMVVMMTDIKHSPKEGVWSDFLGNECVSFGGAALMAKRAGCPVVPFAVVREERRFVIEFLEPIVADMSLPVESIVRLYEKQLGRFVFEHPEQWWWLHDRFRHNRQDEAAENARVLA
jgi:KDO2-lipid IV(A) lauroyltransferase